ncbi:MAG: DNA helicase-2/ATP-dependent DNA helicase PcrA [Flavobacteriaceae bacterium]|jgi:DNA helicase-2/ATP-dependent DNA helicase PcrA
MQHLEELNEQQRRAACHSEGPLLIIAGAGAGKTKTIIARLIELISKGISPHTILAVTFTNKAASEMRERIQVALPHSVLPSISTFHSLGVSILREQSAHLSRNRHFTILDSSDALSYIKQAMKDNGIDTKENDPGRVRNTISRAKGDGFSAQHLLEKNESPHTALSARIWKTYDKLLLENNSYDFDDLLVETHKLLKENEQVRTLYKNRFQYIHIDEYQDTNKIQYEMMSQFIGGAENICVVGDTDQTIYEWRGATIENILKFEEQFPKTQTIFLEQNYRSTQNILEAAHSVIQHNEARHDKKLFTKNEEGSHLQLISAFDEKDEAEKVTQEIFNLIKDGTESKDIAVLYRANFQSRIMEEFCIRRNIPYKIIGTKFYERKEIKDMLSYLRAALSPENLADIKRVINTPRRGIGKVTIAKLFGGQKDTLPAKAQASIHIFYKLLTDIKVHLEKNSLSETLHYIFKQSGLEKELKESMNEDNLEKIGNIGELISTAERYSHLDGIAGAEQMLEDAALSVHESDKAKKMKEHSNAVSLMTIHGSKGLEFKYIFLVGVEEEVFPGGMIHDNPNKLEEERRLMYVALTRAKKKVFLSWAQSRMIFGNRGYHSLSRFVYDIPHEILDGMFSEQKNTSTGSKDSPIDSGDFFEFLKL